MTMRATASRVSVALALIYFGAAPAHAQIYRWLDGTGAMMYSTDRPADPGALKEFTVIDPVRPPTSTLPADTIAQEPPRLQIERDPAVAGAGSLRDAVTEPGPIVIREALPQGVPEAPTAVPAPLPFAGKPAMPVPSIARELDPAPAPIAAPEFESTTTTVREPAPTVLPPVTREAGTQPRETDVSRQSKPEPTTPSALARDIEGTRGAPVPESQPSKTITIIREPETPARQAVAADKPATPAAAPQETDASTPAKAASDVAPRRRARVNPNLPEAVQDPCLRSSDPKCYDKHKNDYVPFHGYSPSAAEARESGVFPPAGATSAPAAGGSGSGGSTGPVKAPKASDYAVPPGSDKPKKLSK